MLKSGDEYRDSLRDGRIIYIGGERVDDVTTHPGFRNGANSFARIWDARLDPRYRDLLTFEEDGQTYPMYYLAPRSRADLERRTRSHEVIADLSYGLLGRSPDFVAGYVTGAAMQAQEFDCHSYRFSEHVTRYFEYCRKNDIYLSHAVAPPQGTRDPEKYGRKAEMVPSLSVTDERDDGIVINGMKMLATAAAFSHEVWIGNILPLAPDRGRESVTCAIPINSPGLTLWSRKPYAQHVVNEFDNPLTYHFDESDCIVVCQNVKVPWERVFTLNDVAWSRQIYFRTPAHTLSNHQASVRYRSKIKLLVGLAQRITESMGTDTVAAVRDSLNHLAAMDAIIRGLIQGQIQEYETVDTLYTCYNRRIMYAAIYWATQNYDKICSRVRELMGGSVLQMPADISVMDNADTRDIFEHNWATPTWSAKDKMKLFKLAWDLLGTDFAGRHMQYERFYMGPAFVVRDHVSRETPWDDILGYADQLLASYE